MVRRVVPIVALVVISILVSLLIGEAGSRALGYQPRHIFVNQNFWVTGWAAMDEELGWRNRQGAFRSVEPGQALMTFESDGRRHDPIGPKGPGLAKILVVGCSFTQGEGVPDDEPYPHVLNRALPDFEVLNFGTGGYGTYQSLLRIRSYFHASHAPTPLVIYGYIGHHIDRNVATPDWVSMLTTRDGRYLVPPHVRLSGDRLIELAGYPVELWPLETSSALVALVHNAAMKSMLYVRWRDRHQVTHRLMHEMQATVRANRASLLVVGLAGTLPTDFEWMQQEGVDYLNCEHPDAMQPQWRVGGWGHPNRHLHEYWGKCILLGLAARGYPVPASE